MQQFLVIGSRGSKLALTQADIIKSQLQLSDLSVQISIEIIKTSGDARTEPLAVIGGKGVFTKELEDALLDQRIDIAVHSLKDLPTMLPDGLAIGAICKRDDPRDGLVLPKSAKQSTFGIAKLRPGAIVGTSSPRRLSQLSNLRKDLEIRDIRGNVDTRLRKLDDGEFDALVLACAGLRRLKLDNRISAALTTREMLPAVGQGALAIEIRSDDEATRSLVSKLDHKFTRLACEAERAFLRALGGGCQLPIAAHAVVREKRIRLDGLVGATDGQRIVRERLNGSLDDAENLGRQLAEQIMAKGALELLEK